MDAFVPLLGTWQGRERLQQSGSADAADARAMITMKFDVGGLIVVQEYRQVREDGTEFLGHGVFLADADRVLWWFFDSAGGPPVPAEGCFSDDGELVLTKTTPYGTAEHRWRVVGEELEYRIGLGSADAEVQPFLGGRYRRLSTH